MNKLHVGAAAMQTVLTILGCFLGLLAVKHLTDSFTISRKRKRLESEIRALADDLTTNPEGPSLRDAVDLFPVEMIEELVVELRKMPVGSRSLQRAIEITGDENCEGTRDEAKERKGEGGS